MINLIKMDFFRLFKSKNTYITLFFVVLFSLIIFGMSASFGGQNESGDIQDVSAEYSESYIGFTGVDFTADTKITYEVLIKSFLSSGVFLIFAGIFATNVVCGKYKSSFMKNLNVYSKKKWQLIISENLPMLVFVVIEIILVSLILLLCSIMYFKDFSIGSWSVVLQYVGMQILMHYAFATLIMGIAELTRGQILSITITSLLSMGIGMLVTNKLDEIFGWKKFSFTESLIEYNVKLMPLKFDSETWGKAIAVVIFSLVVYNVVSAVIVSHRDMA